MQPTDEQLLQFALTMMSVIEYSKIGAPYKEKYMECIDLLYVRLGLDKES